MTVLILLLALLFQPPAAASVGVFPLPVAVDQSDGEVAPRPNALLTPGRTRPLSLDVVCSTRWGVDRRVVTTAMKRHVFAAYGLAWDTRGEYEVDHLIPRSLGGADDVLNLWPQPWAGTYGARRKDVLEVKLGKLVCAGELPLRAAQRAIAADWVAAYDRYVDMKGAR